MSLPGISKHLKVLERAGLIERGREAQWRPRRLVAEPLAEADAWLQAYRPFWEARFDRMDEVLRRLQAAKKTVAAAKKTAATNVATNVAKKTAARKPLPTPPPPRRTRTRK